MKQTILLWILAFIITAASATYQRMTGPTYPVKGTVTFEGKDLPYQLPHSHGGTTDCPIEIRTDDPGISGTLSWKRYKTNDDWTNIPMHYENGLLVSALPNQPPAGKLEYTVAIGRGEQQALLQGGEPTVIRFKGDVPIWVLIPHVLAMFGGMFLSARAGLEIFRKERRLKRLMYWTLATLAVGGFILGPIVQKYAFGAYWTGWPFGHDLTDNKTALAVLAWAVAVYMQRRSKYPERWAVGAALVTFAVFMIPHSVLGSELKYDNLPKS